MFVKYVILIKTIKMSKARKHGAYQIHQYSIPQWVAGGRSILDLCFLDGTS